MNNINFPLLVALVAFAASLAVFVVTLDVRRQVDRMVCDLGVLNSELNNLWLSFNTVQDARLSDSPVSTPLTEEAKSLYELAQPAPSPAPSLVPHTPASRNKRQEKLLSKLDILGAVSARALAANMGLNHRRVSKDLLVLEAAGVVRRIGGGRSTKWEAV